MKRSIVLKRVLLCLGVVSLAGFVQASDWRTQCPIHADSIQSLTSFDTRLLTEAVSAGSDLTSLPTGLIFVVR